MLSPDPCPEEQRSKSWPTCSLCSRDETARGEVLKRTNFSHLCTGEKRTGLTRIKKEGGNLAPVRKLCLNLRKQSVCMTLFDPTCSLCSRDETARGEVLKRTNFAHLCTGEKRTGLTRIKKEGANLAPVRKLCLNLRKQSV